MRYKTFSGGILLPNLDYEFIEQPIRKMPPPSIVILPLEVKKTEKTFYKSNDNILIEKGKRVKVGTLLSRESIVSTLAGRVKDITIYPDFSGEKILSCLIESDGTEEVEKRTSLGSRFWSISPPELLHFLREGGVALQNPNDKEIITIFVILSEDESNFFASYRLFLEKDEIFLEGIRILQRVYNCQRVIIVWDGVEKKIGDRLKRLVSSKENLHLRLVERKYPQKEKELLLRTLLSKDEQNELIGQRVDVVIIDSENVNAVAELVLFGKSYVEKTITVTGDVVKHPIALTVRIGTKVKDIISFLEIDRKRLTKIIIGGFFRGYAQYTEEIPIGKEIKGLIFLSENMTRIPNPSLCIRCSLCLEVCPHSLNPASLAKFVENRLFHRALSINLDKCTECGCCEVICPSKIRLLHLLRWGKNEIRKGNLYCAQ